jgi:hypothetical protein
MVGDDYPQRPGPLTAIGAAASVRHEIHRYSVDAITEMSRRRAVVKNVPEMAPTICAMDFSPDHTVASINRCLDRILDWIVEARPSSATLELLF